MLNDYEGRRLTACGDASGCQQSEGVDVEYLLLSGERGLRWRAPPAGDAGSVAGHREHAPSLLDSLVGAGFLCIWIPWLSWTVSLSLFFGQFVERWGCADVGWWQRQWPAWLAMRGWTV